MHLSELGSSTWNVTNYVATVDMSLVYSEIHVPLDGCIQYNAYAYIYIYIHCVYSVCTHTPGKLTWNPKKLEVWKMILLFNYRFRIKYFGEAFFWNINSSSLCHYIHPGS